VLLELKYKVEGFLGRSKRDVSAIGMGEREKQRKRKTVERQEIFGYFHLS
jgi:hypothetical protein